MTKKPVKKAAPAKKVAPDKKAKAKLETEGQDRD